MQRMFSDRPGSGRFLACLMLLPLMTLSAQSRIECTAKTSFANWGSQEYNLDELGRGSGVALRPGVSVRTGRFVFSGEAEWGRYTFEPSLFQYVFYNAEDERILWQSDDGLLRPVRMNVDLTAGIAWGRSAVVFLAAKVTSVRFNQYLAAEQYRYNSSTATWSKFAEGEVKYSQSESRTWLGIGCTFQLPVWYRQFTLDGTLTYYVFNEERYNVIIGEVLLGRRLTPRLTLSGGGRFEMLTSGELLGSIWSLTAGLSYRLPLKHS
ncbi:hypothetical protein JXO52_12220 [bacterium]|nr:hypothetical protein [bacterium]